MSTYVLVHGSFHGGWCWERVVPLLEAAGHRAVAVDLPGRGAATPGTLAEYADAVARSIDAQPEPVVLVGHSMGGVVVTQTAEARADRIRALAYVCAFLPADGQPLIALAQTDTESRLLPALVFDPPWHHPRTEAVRDVFYHDCPEADAERARARLVKEPLSVVETPVRTTAANFGRLPRVYIECTEDRALGPSLQRRMHAATPCRVLTLASSHSPFYSQPEALVRHLLTV